MKTYAARFAEVEMFVVCLVRRQVESIQSISVGVLGSADVVAFVVEEFSGTAEQRVLSADVRLFV